MTTPAASFRDKLEEAIKMLAAQNNDTTPRGDETINYSTLAKGARLHSLQWELGTCEDVTVYLGTAQYESTHTGITDRMRHYLVLTTPRKRSAWIEVRSPKPFGTPDLAIELVVQALDSLDRLDHLVAA